MTETETDAKNPFGIHMSLISLHIRDKFMKYIRGIFVFFVIITFGYFILGQIFLPQDAPDPGYDFHKVQLDWELVHPDGTKEKLESTGTVGKDVVLEAVIPEFPSEKTDCICLRGEGMQVYIDGVLQLEYSTDETRLLGTRNAEAYTFLSVTPQDAGKTLRVHFQSETGILYGVFMGNRLGIWEHMVSQYGRDVLIAVITLFLGLVCIIVSVALKFIYHVEIKLVYLGTGVVFSAVWLIMNSVFRQLIFPNISTVSDMAFLMILLLPYPFILYLNELQERRYEKLYIGVLGVDTLDFVLCVALHVLRVVDFSTSIAAMAFCCVASIIILCGTVVTDFIKKRIHSYWLVAVGLGCVFLAAVIQIVLYFQRTGEYSGSTLSIGIIMLLTFSVMNAGKEIFRMETEKRQAVYVSELKGNFLANMSHEIRTPINAILGMDAMILRESRENGIKEYAMDIQNAGQNLLSLINDILDFSKIESGKMELIPIDYSLGMLIHDVMNMVSIKAGDKGLKMKLTADENLPSRLFGDDVRIRQIILNLMNNAVKYTQKGTVSLTVTGEYVDEESILLHISVKDTGIGIKEEDIEKLFQPYQRVDEMKNRNIEGTGLGITISRQLLNQMGSELQVTSIYGRGSTFYFDLVQKVMSREPMGNIEEDFHKQTEGYQYQVGFTAMDASLLVVDDNHMNRKVFVSLLKKTHAQIDDASSGQESIDMVQKKHYDIIFMDHMMPEMDGIEALHILKEQYAEYVKDTVIVVLTANAIAGAREMYLSEGFDDFLSKPVDPEKLEKTVFKYLPDDKVNQVETQEKTEILGYEQKDEKSLDEIMEILSGIPEINVEYALIFNPGADFLFDMIGDFMKTINSEATELEGFFNELKANPCEATFKQYRIKVHSMKSSSASVGIMVLSGIAKMLEDAARNEKLEPILQVTPAFLEEWRSYKTKLAACDKQPEQEKVEFIADLVLEQLDQLYDAVSEMNIDETDSFTDMLKLFDYPDDLLPVMEDIYADAYNLNAEKLAEDMGRFVVVSEGGEDPNKELVSQTQQAAAPGAEGTSLTAGVPDGDNEQEDRQEDEMATLLLVDDNEMSIKNAEMILKGRYIVNSAKSGNEALEYFKDHTADLILMDIHMPDLDGYEVVHILRSKENTKDIPVIFLTADNSQQAEVKCFEAGASDFINKPFVAEIMFQRIKRILSLDRLQKNLKLEVEKQTELSEKRRKKVERVSLQAMLTLAATVDVKDQFTKDHSTRVAEYARMIAKRAGKSEREQEEIYFIGLLHDVGKIGVPDEILNKTEALTEEEAEVIRKHPVVGHQILQKMSETPEIAMGARWHHERYDGTGYPDQLAGEAIPEYARILAVADAYDAMTSNRSYRTIMTQEMVYEEIAREKGKQFDPVFADIMLQLIMEDTEFKMIGLPMENV